VSNAAACVLCPVAHLSTLPRRLRALMEDARVWKAGCGITGDAAKVFTDLGVRMAALYDTALVAPLLGEYPAPGLKGLCAAFGRAIHKQKNVSMSDWGQRPLKQRQQEYAAQDAFASHWLVVQLHAAHAEGEALHAWLGRYGRGGARSGGAALAARAAAPAEAQGRESQERKRRAEAEAERP
jgi:ribonuclease D